MQRFNTGIRIACLESSFISELCYLTVTHDGFYLTVLDKMNMHTRQREAETHILRLLKRHEQLIFATFVNVQGNRLLLTVDNEAKLQLYD